MSELKPEIPAKVLSKACVYAGCVHPALLPGENWQEYLQIASWKEVVDIYSPYYKIEFLLKGGGGELQSMDGIHVKEPFLPKVTYKKIGGPIAAIPKVTNITDSFVESFKGRLDFYVWHSVSIFDIRSLCCADGLIRVNLTYLASMIKCLEKHKHSHKVFIPKGMIKDSMKYELFLKSMMFHENGEPSQKIDAMTLAGHEKKVTHPQTVDYGTFKKFIHYHGISFETPKAVQDNEE